MDKNYKLFAAIDLGSNAARMQIVQINKDGSYDVLEDLFKRIDMGEEVFSQGYVNRDSVKELCDTLNGFKKVMRDYKVKKHKIIATSALREAEQKEYLIDYIEINTGFKVEVVNSCQETFFKYKALKKKCAIFLNGEKTTLVLDIGAGGIEISIYKGANLFSSHHLNLGTLRTITFFEDLQNKTITFNRVLTAYLTGKLHMLINEFSSKAIDELIVIGGETKALINICNSKSEGSIKFIKTEEFKSVYDQLKNSIPSQTSKKYKLPIEVCEQLIPTIVLINIISDICKSNTIIFPCVSLKDGIIEDFLDTTVNKENYIRGLENILVLVKNICRKYNYDELHADYVEKMSVQLFDKTIKLHGLSEKDKFILRLAAQLHDLGKYVNMDNYYIHSYNIINSLNLIGVSSANRNLIACIAKYHYIKDIDFDDNAYKKLIPKQKVLVAKLTAILQLADYMDIQRKQYINNPEFELSKDKLTIHVKEDKDLTLEEWIIKSQSTLISDVLGINVIIKRS